MTRVYFDFETRSCADLKKVGSAAYARDPSTGITTCVFRHEDGGQVVWAPGCTFALPGTIGGPDLPLAVRKWVERGFTFVAHNCEMFDALIWRAKIPGPVPRFADTIHQARLCGLPGKLDDLLFALLGKRKADDTAMRFLMQSKYVGSPPVVAHVKGNPVLWKKLVAYNIADVEDLQEMSRLMGPMNHDLPGVNELHWKINERGFLVDPKYVRGIITSFTRIGAKAGADVEKVTGGKLNADSLRSPVKVKKYLSSVGIDMPSLNKKAVEEWLIDHAGEPGAADAGTVLLGRQAVCRAAIGKMGRVLTEMHPETNRVHNWAQYHAAGTGRFSGRGVQPHNFPNKSPKAFVSDLRRVTDADELSALSRSIIRPSKGKRFYIGDYNAIESRVLGELAGCKALLDVFHRGEDFHAATASAVYGRKITKADNTERQVGKVINLACGFQMSPTTFAAYCHAARVDLAAAGVTAEKCVGTFRETFWEVKRFWNLAGKAVLSAVKDRKTSFVGGCKFELAGTWLEITLPSSRKLRYADPRIVQGDFGPQVEYWNYRGYWKSLYGGLVVENIVQATARDILCDGMVRVDPIAPVVLHVHDEIACESERDVKHDMEAVLNRPPIWLPRIPLKIEVFASDVYSKAPVKLGRVRHDSAKRPR